MLKKPLFLSLLFISSITQSIITSVEIFKHEETGRMLYLLGDFHIDHPDLEITKQQHLDIVAAVINNNAVLLAEDKGNDWKVTHNQYLQQKPFYHCLNRWVSKKNNYNIQIKVTSGDHRISLNKETSLKECPEKNFSLALHVSPLIGLCKSLQSNEKTLCFNIDPRVPIKNALTNGDSYQFVLKNKVKPLLLKQFSDSSTILNKYYDKIQGLYETAKKNRFHFNFSSIFPKESIKQIKSRCLYEKINYLNHKVLYDLVEINILNKIYEINTLSQTNSPIFVAAGKSHTDNVSALLPQLGYQKIKHYTSQEQIMCIKNIFSIRYFFKKLTTITQYKIINLQKALAPIKTATPVQIQRKLAPALATNA